MSSTNKTSLGLNMWEASDKPVRQDFVNDNVIIDEEVNKLKQDIVVGNAATDEKINKLNSNLEGLDATVDSLNTDVENMKPVTSRFATSVPDNTDFGTLFQPGWYDIYSSVNAPATGIGRILLRVESINVNGSWITTQSAVEWYSTGAIQAKLYRRWITNINGTYAWTSWIQTI